MNKSLLRKKYKDLRAKLSKEEVEDKSLQIANQLLKLDIWDYKNYHIFLPIEKNNEVNTEYIIQILQGKDKNVIIPKSNFENFSLTNFLLTDNTTFVTNEWGIPEPIDGIVINSKSIDLVFVPLLAYDTKGNRIGYGKGFYDRFLNKAQPKKVIGLSFFPPEKHILDMLNTDYPMDYCVLHDKTYEFI